MVESQKQTLVWKGIIFQWKVGEFPIVVNTANSYSYGNQSDKGDEFERASTGSIGQHNYRRQSH